MSYSAIDTWGKCPRRYYYAYVLKRVRVAKSDVLRLGSIMHEALAAWWTGGPTEAHAELMKHVADMTEEEAAKLAAMLENYDPPRGDYHVVGVEMPFEMTIPNPNSSRPLYGVRLVGKADGVVINDAGRWVLEHKTSAEDITGFSPYWQRLSIDHQIAWYCLAHKAVGAVYDVLRKPQIKLCGKDEKAAGDGETAADAYQRRCSEVIKADPTAWYQCREVIQTPDELHESLSDLYLSARAIRDSRKRGEFPRRCGSCRSHYGTCPYLGVCCGEAEIEDEMLFRTKTAEHDELTTASKSGSIDWAAARIVREG